METCQDAMDKQNMYTSHLNKFIKNSLKGNNMCIYQLDNGAYKGNDTKNACIMLDLLSTYFKNE